jgi:uncharacterized protein DUF4154
MTLSTAFDVVQGRRVRPPLRAGWIVLTAAICFISAQLPGQTSKLTPSEVRVSFVLNLVKFVEWPDATFPSTGQPFNFCIVGADPLGMALSQAIYQQPIKGRTVTVHRYNFGEDLRRCHVLFLDASEQARMMQILSGVVGSSVLTVSDMQGFAEAGGVVQFAVEENRVHFSVNREAATQARLQISAKLLTLSNVIRDVRTR